MDAETTAPYKQDFTGVTVDFSTWSTAPDKYTGAFSTAASIGMAAFSAMALFS